jgi:hypothetical protein
MKGPMILPLKTMPQSPEDLKSSTRETYTREILRSQSCLFKAGTSSG